METRSFYLLLIWHHCVIMLGHAQKEILVVEQKDGASGSTAGIYAALSS
jgi:hypothetical protein